LYWVNLATYQDTSPYLSLAIFVTYYTLIPSNPEEPTKSLATNPQSFFDVAQTLIGAGEGSGDISTNPDYMQGYGQ
jgi:hypothetical protein